MADIFKNYTVRLDSPLSDGEVVTNVSGSDFTFDQLPRALNCSAEGTLIVSMGSLVSQSLYVQPGINPYRVIKTHSGSADMTVIGLY